MFFTGKTAKIQAITEHELISGNSSQASKQMQIIYTPFSGFPLPRLCQNLISDLMYTNYMLDGVVLTPQIAGHNLKNKLGQTNN